MPESVRPTADDPPCLTYLYFSAVEPIKDTSSGLVGPLLVCKRGVLNADATQVGLKVTGLTGLCVREIRNVARE